MTDIKKTRIVAGIKDSVFYNDGCSIINLLKGQDKIDERFGFRQVHSTCITFRWRLTSTHHRAIAKSGNNTSFGI